MVYIAHNYIDRNRGDYVGNITGVRDFFDIALGIIKNREHKCFFI